MFVYSFIIVDILINSVKFYANEIIDYLLMNIL